MVRFFSLPFFMLLVLISHACTRTRPLTLSFFFSVTVIRTGLLSGKLSQTTQTLHVIRATSRTFEHAQWELLASRLTAWKAGLEGVLEIVESARKKNESLVAKVSEKKEKDVAKEKERKEGGEKKEAVAVDEGEGGPVVVEGGAEVAVGA